jgi:cardiolipin-specific phospholipase
MLVGSYSSRRFPSLDEEYTKDLHEYLLNISLAKGSGEHAYSHLLAFGAQARLPLEHRIDQLEIPVTFMYGDQDWVRLVCFASRTNVGGLTCPRRWTPRVAFAA